MSTNLDLRAAVMPPGDDVHTQDFASSEIPAVAAPSFTDVMDYTQPSVKTQDLNLIRIGEQLQTEIQPVLPQGVPTYKVDDSTKQLPWLVIGLVLSFLLTEFFFKRRGKK